MAPNGIEDRAGTKFTTRPMLEAGEASLKGQTMVACSTIFPALDKGSLGRAGVYFAPLDPGSGRRSLSPSTTAIWRCSYGFGAQIRTILEATKKAPTQIGGLSGPDLLHAMLRPRR
jgi:hypothetical protein